MNSLLIEIGTEELPAGIIKQIANYIENKISEILKPQIKRTFFTPRRIAFLFQNFYDIEREEEEIIVGPPKKVCFDSENKPTQALLKFLQANEATLENVIEIERKGGLYIAIKRIRKGKKPTELLIENFEDILLSVPTPKNMRWTSSYRIKFPRPVRWLCALYNDHVFPIKFGNLEADRITYGHRFLSKERIELKSPLEYEEKLKQNYVIPDYEERLKIVKHLVEEKAKSLGGFVEHVEGLYEEVTNLVEYPFVVVGEIENKFLTLPEKVIVTVLAHHQRFFCVKNKDTLLPYFIAVSNNQPRDDRIVKGYEKVIKARLEDALFFYKEDTKIKLDELVVQLSQVLFHPKAGSMLEKTYRLMNLVEEISKQIGLNQEYIQKAKRAAYLSKADLLTNMVKELNELQGYMGYVYAKLQGEEEEVAKALWEQYLSNPSTTIGKILSLADKIDDLYTLISVGELPTGKSDPYGLRRSAYVVFSIVEREGWDIDIGKLFQEIPENFIDFLRNRLRAYLENYPYDVVDAVLAVCSPLRIKHCLNTVKNITKLKNEESFRNVVLAYKRIHKIIPKDFKGYHVKENLLTKKAELDLWNTLKALENKLTDITDLYTLEKPVNEFFDKVLVMDENMEIRNNRLSLLLRLKNLFNKFADFSKIVYEE